MSMVVVVVSLECLIPVVSIVSCIVPSIVLVVVPSEDMPRLDIPLVVVEGWCITDLRIHRGCAVGRGCLHRSGRSCRAGELRTAWLDIVRYHTLDQIMIFL